MRSPSSQLFSITSLKLVLFFIVTIPLLFRHSKYVYEVSGQAWFFGLKLGDFRLNFPGFSNDFPTILNLADSPLKLIYYLTFVGIVWGASFLLTRTILDKFVDPLFAFIGAIAFHTNPYIMSVFLSAPIWDFFPKILLFQYILIVLLDRYGLADRIKSNTSLHVRFAYTPSFVVLIGATCASFRYSSLNLILLFLFLVVLNNKYSFFLKFLLSLAILVFLSIFLYLIVPGKATQLKLYFISSIFHSNYASSGNIEKFTSLPFMDSLIIDYVEQSSVSELITDKLFYTNILEIIRMYLVQIAENSPLLVFMPSSELSVYFALLLLIIGISLFLSYQVDSIHLLTVMKLYFLFFFSTVLFSFFSRPQVNQDAYLMFFDYWILTIFFHYMYKHRHSFFIFRERAEI